MTRFETNKQLWVKLSLLVFLLPWFTPLVGVKNGEYWWDRFPVVDIIITIFTRPDLWNETFESLIYSSWLLAVPSLLIGWLLQATIVMVRHRKSSIPESTE